MDVASEMRNAVAAIKRVTRAIHDLDGIADVEEIKKLREAVDDLDTILNEQMRKVISNGA